MWRNRSRAQGCCAGSVCSDWRQLWPVSRSASVSINLCHCDPLTRLAAHPPNLSYTGVCVSRGLRRGGGLQGLAGWGWGVGGGLHHSLKGNLAPSRLDRWLHNITVDLAGRSTWPHLCRSDVSPPTPSHLGPPAGTVREREGSRRRSCVEGSG